jgi:hypothetical protein
MSNCSGQRTKKALKSSSKHIAEGDSNSRLLATTMDGMLVHSEFLSTKAKEQVQANVVLATFMADQRNKIKTLSDSVAHIEAKFLSGQQKLRDDLNQGQTKLYGEIDGVRTEVSNINDNINSMKRESAATTAATNSKLDRMMTFMMHDTTLAVAAPVAPAPIPKLQPPRSSLNPSASPFLAPTLSALSLPVSSVTPVTAPTSSVAVSKDTFKPTKHHKTASKSVYPFAENFYRVTEGKSDEQINDEPLFRRRRTWEVSPCLLSFRSNC